MSLEAIDTLGNSVNLSSTGRLAVHETSCLDNGEGLIKRMFVRAADAGIEMGIDRYSSQDISNTAWAYSTLGLLHTRFFKEMEKVIVPRLTHKRHKLRGQEISNILWSFATLNAKPNPTIVDAVSSYVAAECSGKNGIDVSLITKLFGGRQELANLACKTRSAANFCFDFCCLMTRIFKYFVTFSRELRRHRKISTKIDECLVHRAHRHGQ